MRFIPFYDSVEVEPIDANSVIAGGNEKIEAAKIISLGSAVYDVAVDDIIFFRPHGFFELPEYEGKRRFIVKIAPEYILGVMKEDNP